MSLEEFKKILEEVGIPVAYSAFEKAQPPPYICYTEPGSNNFMADGKVYLKVKMLMVELYTRYRDTDLEDAVEAALADFPWQKTMSFINNEGIHETIYELEV